MIKTLDRYLLRYFILSMIVVAIGIGIIIVAINMIEELRSFIDHDVPFADIAKYYFYFAGWILKSFLPVFVLLAALISIGILARRNEVLAMKASGVSLYRIATPLLVFTFLLSLAHVYYNEVIFAEANKTRVELKEFTIKGRSQRGRHSSYNIYRQIDRNMFYTISTYHVDRMDGDDVRIYRSENNKLKELITARIIKFTDRNWMLYNGVRRLFTDTSENYVTFDSLPAPYIKDKPSDFERPLGKPEDMGYRELEYYIEVMKRTGGPYTRELVDLKTKLAFPFSSFIVILICVPIASNPKRGGIAISFALGAGIALMYFVFFKVMQSLGHSGKIMPDLAAWIMNGIFFVIGIIIMLRSRK